MKQKFVSLFTCLIFIFATFSISAEHTFMPDENGIKPPKWEKLGQRKVNYGIDKDEILVTAREGTFKAVKLIVRGAPLNMHKMVIHFGDGSTQNVQIKNNIPKGQATRTIDLKGQKRVIKKVVFWYDTKNRAPKRATVELWGKHW